MRLNLSHEQTIRGGAKPIQSNVHKTSINNTIFRIVTKGLYIRPIEAIVREICTNALDGHIAAGTPELPFDVTLPSPLKPYFIVRDYGVSMDNDTVFNVYAVLGESTKNSTSNSIGGWGVGGKSPAAYTDTFFITTYKDGVRRIYQSSCLQNSSPLELLLEGFTDEKNGVEVKIPIKSDDFDRFTNAAKIQLAPFDVKPNIIRGLSSAIDFEYQYDLTKADSFKITPSLYLPDDNGDLIKSSTEVSVYLEATKHTLAIRMGCVVYPINVTSEFYNQYEEKLKVIKNISGAYNILIDLPVDTVDIKPSREDLDYTERTNNVLTAVMSSLNKYYLTQAITIAYQARLLPTNEAIEYIFNNSPSEDMTKYIMCRYSTKPDFSPVRMKYTNVPFSYVDFAYQTIKNFNKDRETPIEFIVCNGQKTKKFDNADVRFWYTISRSIVLIKRDAGYIKKLNHWFDEGKLAESGLVSKYKVSGCSPYYKRSVEDNYYKRNFLVNGSCPKYLVVNDTDLDATQALLEKLFMHVEVVELEDLPKQVKERNRVINASGNLREVDTEVFLWDGTRIRRTKYCKHSISAIKEACDAYTEQYDHEVVFTTTKNAYYNTEKLKELCKYHKINVVTFDLPYGFAERLHNSKNVKFVEMKVIMETMLSNIPDSVKTEWKNRSIKRMKFTKIRDFAYSSLECFLIQIPEIKDYFFKFVPKHVLAPDFPNLASMHITSKEYDYLDKEASINFKRIKKRLDLLQTRRPTLKLLSSNTNSSLIVELFKLNFKGFNPDANE